MPKVRNFLKDLVAYSHELDPTRPAGIGGCQRGDIDKLGDVAGYNGDGARLFVNPGIPSVVTEYGSTMADRPGKYDPGWGDLPSTPGADRNVEGSWRLPWRSGEVIWCAFDHGSIAGRRFGAMGMVDYFRLPKRQWYWYRNEYLHIPPPAWPSNGVPAALKLTADKTTLKSVDGTDDAQLIVTVVDKDGKADQQLSAGDARHRIRPGRISDRTEHHLRAGLGHRDSRRHGGDGISFLLRREDGDSRHVAGIERCDDSNHFAGRAEIHRRQNAVRETASVCAFHGNADDGFARSLWE